jgi:hypothetical protein
MAIDTKKKYLPKVKSKKSKEWGGKVARNAFHRHVDNLKNLKSFFFNTKSSKQSPKKSTTHSSYLFQGGYDGPDYQPPNTSLSKASIQTLKLRYADPSPKKTPKKKTPNPYPSFDLYGDD